MPNKQAEKTDESKFAMYRDQNKRTHPGRYARVFLFLLAGILLLWYVSSGQDVQLILKEFREANYFWIFLAVVAAILSHIIRALRWNLLVSSLGNKTSNSQVFNALMAGYLSNLVIPRLGEITRCVVLNKLTRVPFNSLVGTVVAERVFDVFSLGVIILLTITFQFNFLKGFMNRLIFDPLLSKGAQNWPLLLFLGIVFIITAIAVVAFMKRKFADPPHNGFFYRMKRQYSGLKNGLLTIWITPNKSLFLLYSLFIWGFYFLNVYLCFFALQSTAILPPSAGLTLLVMGSLGVLAPVPGGIGTYHFLTITTLTELYSIAPEPAISYAYIAHASQTLVILITGAYAWLSLSVKKQIAPLA